MPIALGEVREAFESWVLLWSSVAVRETHNPKNPLSRRLHPVATNVAAESRSASSEALRAFGTTLDGMLGLKRAGRPAYAGRVLLVAALVCLACTAVTSSAGAAVETPKKGQYVGETRDDGEATLDVGSRSIDKAVFEVDCGLGSGRLSLRRVDVRETKEGRFIFDSSRRRPVKYDDGHATERGSVTISGRFARTGRRAWGSVRVDTPHCDGSGKVRWSARYTATRVKEPKPGWYSGPTEQQRKLGLHVSGTTIDVAAIAFRCGGATGRTVLNDVHMRRTWRGFAFDISAHGSVTYSDGYPDENAAIDLAGRFTRSGFRASGRLSVTAPRCGGTGRVDWTAKREDTG
jgi:hypothetical protein